MIQHRQSAALAFIVLLMIFNSCGDLLMARTMRTIGDVDVLRRKAGILAVARAVLSSTTFYGALFCMAAGFYSLLTALSLGDLSFVVPAQSSLTFLSNLVGAKFFLKEHVDHRRWIAGTVVMCGIVLLKAS
jgi:uncharacterized membrane protein